MSTSASLLSQEVTLLDHFLKLRGDVYHEILLGLVNGSPCLNLLGHPGGKLLWHEGVESIKKLRADKNLHICNPVTIEQCMVAGLREVCFELLVSFQESEHCFDVESLVLRDSNEVDISSFVMLKD